MVFRESDPDQQEDTVIDIEAFKARLAAARDDDYANIPEDMASRVDGIFQDMDTMIEIVGAFVELAADEQKNPSTYEGDLADVLTVYLTNFGADRWSCGCPRNPAGAHRKGCPDYPDGVEG